MQKLILMWILAASLLLMTTSPLSADRQSQVSQLQSRLLEEGFDVGEIDGKLGPSTRRAIKQFQMSRNIEATGRLDEQTLSELQVGGRAERSVASDKKSPPAPITNPDTGSADAQSSPGSTY